LAMAIPPIHPYPMPTEDELPDNVAGWRPDPNRAALLVHDLQRYFVEAFPAGAPPVTDLLANVAALRDAARRVGLPVIYTAQPGGLSPERRGRLAAFWGPGMIAEPRCRDIVAAVAPGPSDVVVAKDRYSAFHATTLLDALGGRDQLIVCGVFAHIGCLMTTNDALAHDIEAFLVADAVADFSSRHHRMALDYAAANCAVVLTTARLLNRQGWFR